MNVFQIAFPLCIFFCILCVLLVMYKRREDNKTMEDAYAHNVTKPSRPIDDFWVNLAAARACVKSRNISAAEKLYIQAIANLKQAEAEKDLVVIQSSEMGSPDSRRRRQRLHDEYRVSAEVDYNSDESSDVSSTASSVGVLDQAKMYFELAEVERALEKRKNAVLYYKRARILLHDPWSDTWFGSPLMDQEATPEPRTFLDLRESVIRDLQAADDIENISSPRPSRKRQSENVAKVLSADVSPGGRSISHNLSSSDESEVVSVDFDVDADVDALLTPIGNGGINNEFDEYLQLALARRSGENLTNGALASDGSIAVANVQKVSVSSTDSFDSGIGDERSSIADFYPEGGDVEPTTSWLVPEHMLERVSVGAQWNFEDGGEKSDGCVVDFDDVYEGCPTEGESEDFPLDTSIRNLGDMKRNPLFGESLEGRKSLMGITGAMQPSEDKMNEYLNENPGSEDVASSYQQCFPLVDDQEDGSHSCEADEANPDTESSNDSFVVA